jgi:LL-diaminopimelate aminotransferase
MNIPVADRLQNVEEYFFSRKLAQIQEMRNSGIDVINLGIGSPDLMPGDEVLQALEKSAREPQAHGYMPYRSLPELREAMAAWYRTTYQVAVDPAREILPLLGSKEGILYLSLAVLNPGDTVLVPNPGYPAYASVAELIGARVLYYDLTEANGWLPDLAALGAQDLARCKLMWINYPHMPTGTVAHAEDLRRLLDFAKQNQILLCNDNPYGLILNETPPLSLLSLDPQKEVSAELNSLSKSFNMAGWRVGMLMGSPALIDAVLRVKSNVDSGMFRPVQAGAIAALQSTPEWHQRRNDVYRKRREQVWKIFDRLSLEYSRQQVGLFVWARVPDTVTDVAAYLDRVLQEAHVFFTPGQIFGSNGKRYVRASLCAPEARLHQALERIERWLA